MVRVGDAGNAPYLLWGAELGEVDYSYQLGMYEQTVPNYCGLLNAVASQPDENNVVDPHGLWNDAMAQWIRRTKNNDGSYFYQVIPGSEKLPISHASLCSALRCCNWHEHGAPILQAGEDSDAITEHGSYEFAVDGTFTPNPHARFVIPSQNEWIKAAYYQGNCLNARYWSYPTQSNNNPGNNCDDVTNQANYNSRSWLSSPFLRLTNVDLFNDSKSFYGCRDMGGNVNEWTTTQDASGKYIVRGGSYESEYSYTRSNDLMITATPQSYPPDEANGLIGFRIEEKNLSEPIAASNDALLTDAINEIQENPGWTGAGSAWAYAVVRGLYNLIPKKYEYIVPSIHPDENDKRVLVREQFETGKTTEFTRTISVQGISITKGYKTIVKPTNSAELEDFLFSTSHMDYSDQVQKIPMNATGYDGNTYQLLIRQNMTPERTWYKRTIFTNIVEMFGYPTESCSAEIFEASKQFLINGVAGAVLGAACSYAGECSGEAIGYLLAGSSGGAEGKNIGGKIGTVMGIILPWCLL